MSGEQETNITFNEYTLEDFIDNGLALINNISLDLDREESLNTVIVKQNDNKSRVLCIKLLHNKSCYQIPPDCKVRVKYCKPKPDGHTVIDDCIVHNNRVYMLYRKEMLAVPGDAKAEIVLTLNDKELKSATFTTKIIKTVFEDENVDYENEFISLFNILNEAETAMEEITLKLNSGDFVGEQGVQGLPGNDGAVATIAIGAVTTGKAGTSASVVNSGTENAAVLDFVIPRGDTGVSNGTGDGIGTSATIEVGNVITGEPGTNAIITNTGTSTDAVFDFTIPRGEMGLQGEKGEIGASAYDIAISNGFIGTEQEWVGSLKGENGTTGNDGITPHVDSTTGNWFIGTVDTGIRVQGKDGENFDPADVDRIAALETKSDTLATSINTNTTNISNNTTDIQYIKDENAGKVTLLNTVDTRSTTNTSDISSLQTDLINHIDDAITHITAKERALWNAGTGSSTDGTFDHSVLINRDLANAHPAKAITFDDGDSFQDKYDAGELTGATGTAGSNGTDGANGKSAYKVAIENGFAGTENEWLDSLRGTQGIAGKDGAKGEHGSNGSDGKSAYEIAVANGLTEATNEADWIISLQGAGGEQGIQGLSGNDGANGIDGYTPVKGVDYFTDDDINNIITAVLAAIPVNTSLAERLAGGV